MNELKRLSKEDLRKILDETQEQIDEIRSELQQRELRDQHEAIDALELHLERSHVNWGQVRDFFRLVLAELRGSSK